jgi:hypothetical protein
MARQPAGCPHCRQAFLVEPDQIGDLCPNCGHEKLAAQPALLRSEAPELYLPFTRNPGDLLPIYRDFTRGVWLHSDDFTPENLASRARPLFWPMWLVDAQVEGSWQGEIGYDYQVKSAQESYSDSGWRSHEVVEDRIRWEPRTGLLARTYNNTAVPALSEHARLAALVKNYPLDKAGVYDAHSVGSAGLRLPDVQPEGAWPLAKESLEKQAGVDCARAAGGQHVRRYTTQFQYRNLNWTQLLLPVYTSYYTDDNGDPQMVLINGYTGVIGGPRLASQHKGWILAGTLAGIAIALFVLGLILSALVNVAPGLSSFGPLLAIVALLVGVAAIVPAYWPWQWNRNQKK